MLNEVIVYENEKCLSTIYLSSEVSLKDYIEKYLPKNIFYLVIHKDLLPTKYNNFYEAWAFNNTKTAVIVDMPKAREIHRTMLRQERNKELSSLDIAYMRAQENEDTATAKQIAAKKQVLRNIPAHPAIEAAQTPDELLTLTLDALLAL